MLNMILLTNAIELFDYVLSLCKQGPEGNTRITSQK